MMLMGRVNLCESEMSKRMKKKEKSEKRIRKSAKERDLDLVVPGLWKLCRWYLELWKSCRWYSAYNGK